MKNLQALFFLSLFFFNSLYFYAESSLPYPEIENLESDDVFFNQYSVAVSQARKAIASLGKSNDISPEFYTYIVKADENLISISARCCIPYDAIASLNRISSIEEDIEGKRIIIPSLPALYVYKTPHSSLEKLIVSYVKQNTNELKGFEVSLFTSKNKSIQVYCLPNALFNGTIRAFFFMPYYQFPVESRRITSGFGIRRDPFTGKASHHDGIDIAAPNGSPVFPIASGIVVFVGNGRVLGKHIIIRHNDGRESVYGHLRKTTVILNDKVKTSTKIGEVGSTGRSTGYHLHLEIREASRPTDPIKFFRKEF